MVKGLNGGWAAGGPGFLEPELEHRTTPETRAKTKSGHIKLRHLARFKLQELPKASSRQLPAVLQPNITARREAGLNGGVIITHVLYFTN